MLKQRVILAAALLAFVSVHAWASASPAGLWQTIDDETGKPKSLVRITETNGEFRGKVEKVIPKPGADANPKCDKCEGANKDQPIVGMTILTGLKQDDDEYTGGRILDPNNGKTYKCKMSLIDDGKKLKVRGFIGMAWLGRTQVWVRQE